MHCDLFSPHETQRALFPHWAFPKTLAMAVVVLASLLTSLTTVAGFLSFLSARIKPFREMLDYPAVGVVVAFVIAVILVSILYSFGKQKNAKKVSQAVPDHPLSAAPPSRGRIYDSFADATPRSSAGRGIGGGGATQLPQEQRVCRHVFDKSFEMVHRIVIGYPKIVVSVFVGLFVLSVIGYQFVEAESIPAPKLPLRLAHDYVDAHMGGAMSMEIMLDTDQKDKIKDSFFLKQMDTLQQFVNHHPLTTKTVSVLDTMKKMLRILHENRQEHYAILETSEAASQYPFLYEISGGNQLDKIVSFNYDIACPNVKTRSLSTKEAPHNIWPTLMNLLWADNSLLSSYKNGGVVCTRKNHLLSKNYLMMKSGR